MPNRWGIVRSKALFTPRKELARPGDQQLSATQAYGVIPQKEFERKIGRKVTQITRHLEKRRHVERDDFVISMRSFQGGLERAWATGCIRSSYVVLKPAPDVDVGYFSYLFKSHDYIQAVRATANFIRDGQDLNFSNFCLVDLPVVPMDEQKAIAKFLAHVDRRIRRYIRAKRKLIGLLNEQKQAIIHRAVTRGLDPNVRLKPSGVEWIGSFPEHWSLKRLKYVVPGVTVGIVIQPARLYVDAGVPCLRSLNISQGSINTEKLVFISEESNTLQAKSQIHAGDIVVVRTGQAGAAVIVPKEFDGANCIDLLIIRQSRRLVSDYLLLFLRSYAAKCDVEYESVGAIQAHYNTGTLANLRLPVPPLQEQEGIVASVERELGTVEATMARAHREIDLLREYRTRVIADVVTGKLDVREAASRLTDEADTVADELVGGEDVTEDAELDAESEEAEK